MAAQTPPALTGSRAHEVNQIAAWIDQETGNAEAAESGLTGKITYGDEYKVYASGPGASATAAQAYEGWLLTDVGAALTQVIGEGLTGGASDVGQLATEGSAAAGEAVNNPVDKDLGAAESAITSLNPLGGLFQGNIWLRVAEVAIGVILIGIGLNAMLKGKPLQVVTSAAGAAGKAAMLA